MGPVQGGGLYPARYNRSLFRPPPCTGGGRTGRGLNGNPMQEVNFIHHFIDLIEPFFCYVLNPDLMITTGGSLMRCTSCFKQGKNLLHLIHNNPQCTSMHLTHLSSKVLGF